MIVVLIDQGERKKKIIFLWILYKYFILKYKITVISHGITETP